MKHFVVPIFVLLLLTCMLTGYRLREPETRDYAEVLVTCSNESSNVSFDGAWTTIQPDSAKEVQVGAYATQKTPVKFNIEATKIGLVLRKVSGDGRMVVKFTAYRDGQPMVSVSAQYNVCMVMMDGIKVGATGLN